MNTSIPIRFGQITGNVTHFYHNPVLPPLPTIRLPIEYRNGRLDRIAEMVANYFGITLHALMSRNRQQHFAWPRQIAMYISYANTTACYETIASHFRRRAHSTVIQACRTVRDRMDTEPKTRALVESLIQELAQ